MEHIIKFMDKSGSDKFLKVISERPSIFNASLLSNRSKLFDLFRLTIRVRTVGISHRSDADLRLSAAYRTGRRDITDTACQVIRDLRNVMFRLVDL